MDAATLKAVMGNRSGVDFARAVYGTVAVSDFPEEYMRYTR